MDSNTTTYTKTFSIDLERTNYHLKLKKRRIKRIFVIVILWIMIILYFVTPLSKVNLKVTGNVYYSQEELRKMSYINKNDFWWLVDEKKVIKVLESYEYISHVEVKKGITGIKMNITEIYPIGVKNNKYILNNSAVIDKSDYPLNDKITNLTNFDSIDNDDLNQVINKYNEVNLEIREKINKLEIVKDANDYSYIKLYGNDERVGYFVIKCDLVYLNTKFNENKYYKIIEEISKKDVKYSEDKPCLVAYHYLNEEEFHIVDAFEEE